MKILIAEDSQLSRSVLSSILAQYDYTVIEAEHGQEAVEKYVEYDPDVILMDLMMPVMNGYTATRKIKELAGDKFIPIIVITSIVETSSLTESVESGADDYLNKPYNAEAIHAKIIALSRIKTLHDDLRESEQKIEKLSKQAESELLVAEHIYDFVLDKGHNGLTNVRQYMRPVTNFNGDILLTAHTPAGGFNVMLGDFTGHGLSAAIGAIPASEIFYQMTAKGFSIGDIVTEMNQRLQKILPLNMFCAASFIEVDQERTTMSVWNGSMPDIIVTDAEGNMINRVASSHAALGILTPEKFYRKIDILSLQGDERVYMCSDGVLDARNSESVKYSLKSYLRLFENNKQCPVGLNEIVDDLFSFAENGEVNDDISIIEVNMDKKVDSWHADNKDIIGGTRITTEWSASISFDAESLKHTNPVPLLLNMVNGINVIHGHKERLYTVLSELFTNSLDHGLLHLDSSLKSSPEGFQEYFMQRENRLNELTDASISIDMKQRCIDDDWFISIDVKDSGDGFDYDKTRASLDNNEGLSGRGIELIKQICHSIDYNQAGNEVKAMYSFSK